MIDTLVFIGRMQPFHVGHKAVIDAALEQAKEVIIVLGSSFQPRSTKNPFTFEERKAIILAEYSASDRIKFVGVQDYPYDDNAWVSAVQAAVDSVKSGKRVGLIGHSKDSSSYYLKIFPQWRSHIEVPNVDGINATDIRNTLFSEELDLGYIESAIPSRAYSKMKEIVNCSSSFWQALVEEFNEINEYKPSWKNSPYTPTFVTTDAVITQSGYVLLVKRGGFPFKDCWALPGGYLAKGEFVVDNMIKELREETCVKIPAKVLKGSIKNIKIFDHPDRDPRGRTITHGFHVDLGYPDEKLPRVKGADDSKEARWFLLSEVTSQMMAFDHYHIVKQFITTY